MKMELEYDGRTISIPGHMEDGLNRYVEQGMEPGGFLYAVLSNNLREAVIKADGINRNRLVDYIVVLYNNAPAGCWGSPERVEQWMASGGLRGLSKPLAMDS